MARRVGGWVGLLVCVGVAFGILSSAGKPLQVQAVTTAPCRPPACPPAAHSPRPPTSPPATDTPPGGIPTDTAVPTPASTDAAPISPDGQGVAAGVAGVETTPHGLLSVPHDSSAAAAHPGGDLSLVLVIGALLGVIALTAITLAFAMR